MRCVSTADCLLFNTALAEVFLALGAQTANQVAAATTGTKHKVFSLRVLLNVSLCILSWQGLELRGCHCIVVH